MKTWTLLDQCLEDWEEVNEYFMDAESMWRLVQCWRAVGSDADVDTSLEELQLELKDIVAAHAADEDKPEGEKDTGSPHFVSDEKPPTGHVALVKSAMLPTGSFS
ncbi:hypothetical protein DOTSEDRAFT_24258 [Dothistroma septosporum NZE10]|uniref:Uncharacterized protein n=1 Tax=Dothistroma septosporum (strain NZE10 / CBS 128990) TaxID=675120 RepID=N1PL09_DOTSN|nr:hypothetical protein DOTSEDRAFT_24258 [Dothistroma septosporum NZE10]